MKTILLNKGPLALLMLWIASVPASGWDFIHSYRTVSAGNALDYVVEQANVQRTSEGAITYWNPVVPGQEAKLTQKFIFPGAVSEAFLHIDYLYVAQYGGGNFGTGSLWASKDGANWIQLINAPRPVEVAAGHHYSQNLPPALLGGTELWIQARLQANQGHIVAQFLRYDTNGRANNCFELKVNHAAPPGGRPAGRRQ